MAAAGQTVSGGRRSRPAGGRRAVNGGWSHLDGVALRPKCESEGSSDGLTPMFIRGGRYYS